MKIVAGLERSKAKYCRVVLSNQIRKRSSYKLSTHAEHKSETKCSMAWICVENYLIRIDEYII